MEHMLDDSYTLQDTCHRISVQHAFHENVKRERMMVIFHIETPTDKENIEPLPVIQVNLLNLEKKNPLGQKCWIIVPQADKADYFP